MRKYFIAGAVALMVFAIVAFAASLAVDGGVLQAGMDTVDAGEEATLTWTTFVRHDGHFGVEQLTVDFDDPAADGNYAYVNIMEGPGQIIGMAITPIADQQVVLNITDLKAEDVHSVGVLIKNTSDAGDPPGDEYFSGVIVSAD